MGFWRKVRLQIKGSGLYKNSPLNFRELSSDLGEVWILSSYALSSLCCSQNIKALLQENPDHIAPVKARIIIVINYP